MDSVRLIAQIYRYSDTAIQEDKEWINNTKNIITERATMGASSGLIISSIIHYANMRRHPRVIPRRYFVAIATSLTLAAASIGVSSGFMSRYPSLMNLSKESNLKKQLYGLIVEWNPGYTYSVLEHQKQMENKKNPIANK